jgi:hypothetical protein
MSTKSVNKIDRLLAFNLSWNPSDDILDIHYYLEDPHIHLTVLRGQCSAGNRLFRQNLLTLYEPTSQVAPFLAEFHCHLINLYS